MLQRMRHRGRAKYRWLERVAEARIHSRLLSSKFGSGAMDPGIHLTHARGWFCLYMPRRIGSARMASTSLSCRANIIT